MVAFDTFILHRKTIISANSFMISYLWLLIKGYFIDWDNFLKVKPSPRKRMAPVASWTLFWNALKGKYCSKSSKEWVIGAFEKESRVRMRFQYSETAGEKRASWFDIWILARRQVATTSASEYWLPTRNLRLSAKSLSMRCRKFTNYFSASFTVMA